MVTIVLAFDIPRFYDRFIRAAQAPLPK
jgi:hypothetical protein